MSIPTDTVQVGAPVASPAVQDVLDDLAAQHAELDALLAGLDEDGWRAPTPCEGWDVTDVIVHLTQSDELAIASLDGTFTTFFRDGAADVDESAAQGVEAARGASPADVLAAWRTTTARLRSWFGSAHPRARVPWVVGQLTARTLAATRLSECWIHSGDVATALAVEPPPTDRLRHIARLAWRTIPYAFERAGRELHGPVAFHLVGPNGDAWDFDPDEPAVTTITGTAVELCSVAGRRVDPASTSLRGEGPDVESVLELVRTYA